MNKISDNINKGGFKNKLGYIGLGLCLDYFIFRPARSLKPLVFFVLGVCFGIIWEFGVENIARIVSNLVNSF